MARAALALGANMDDPAGQLERAVAALSGTPGIALIARSTMIVSEPWGDVDQGAFHNMAVLVETTLSPHALLEACLAIETAMGRVRTRHWGPRLIDIDVIAYDHAEIATDTLTLPHPYAHERDFVLDPIREIAPDIADWLVARH